MLTYLYSIHMSAVLKYSLGRYGLFRRYTILERSCTHILPAGRDRSCRWPEVVERSRRLKTRSQAGNEWLVAINPAAISPNYFSPEGEGLDVYPTVAYKRPRSMQKIPFRLKLMLSEGIAPVPTPGSHPSLSALFSIRCGYASDDAPKRLKWGER